MNRSELLNLPLVRASQAQKEVSLNEAVLRLEAAVHLVVEGTSNTPHEPVVDGQRWILGDAPSGSWARYEPGQVVARVQGQWYGFKPTDGWIAFDRDRGSHVAFRDGLWQPLGAGGPGGAGSPTAKLQLNLSDGNRTLTAAEFADNLVFAVDLRGAGAVLRQLYVPFGATGLRYVWCTGDNQNAGISVGSAMIGDGEKVAVYFSSDGTAEVAA